MPNKPKEQFKVGDVITDGSEVIKLFGQTDNGEWIISCDNDFNNLSVPVTEKRLRQLGYTLKVVCDKCGK